MNIKHLFASAAVACILSIGFTACSSDDDDFVPTDPEETELNIDLAKDSETKNARGTIVEEKGVFKLRNFQQVEANEEDKVVTSKLYYFDFEENDAGVLKAHSISLSGTTSVEIKANMDEGYTLSYIDSPLEYVKTGDNFKPILTEKKDKEGNVTKESKTDLRKVIMPGFNMPPTEHGWADYYGETHEVRPVADRTFILVKNGKAIYKFKINSIYENETPVDYKNFVFYSIDYQELK